MITDKIKGHIFFQNASAIITGSVIAQLISLVSPFVITYLYAPSEFGKLTVAMSIISLVSGLVTLRHESLIVITKSELEARCLYVTAMTLALTFSSLIFVILFVARFISPDLIKRFDLLIPVGIFTFAAYVTTREFLFRRSKFKADAKVNVTRSWLILTGQVVLGFIRPYASSLLLSKIIGELVGIYLNLKKLINRKESFNFSITKTFIPRYWSQTSHLLVTKLLQSFSTNGVNYIWAFFLDLESLGLFNLASKAIQIPSIFIGENLQKVFEQRTLRYSGSPQDQRKLSLKVIGLKYFIAIILAVLLYLSNIYIFPLFLPKLWLGATKYLAMISPLLITSLPASSIFSIYKMAKKVNILNRMELIENIFKFLLIGFFAFQKNVEMVVYSYVYTGITFGLIKLVYILLRSSNNDLNTVNLDSSE